MATKDEKARRRAAKRAAKYRKLREKIGSQSETAELLEVHPMTISKRERQENPVTREAELALLYLIEHEDDR